MATTLSTNTLSCETTPLLELHSNDQRQTTRLPQTRSFSCAVICIMFVQFCMDTTFFFIIFSLALFARRKEFLDFTPTEVSIVISMFFGTKCIIHVLGTWLADSKLGKFPVILCGTCICLIGTALLLVGLLPMTDIAFTRVFYIIGLIFVAFGQGMATLNSVIFATEQLPNSTTVYSLYYWLNGLLNISFILAGTFFIYIQSISCYCHGHFVPFCFVVLALVVFLAAKPIYIMYPPYGNGVFFEILKIRKEAIRNSRRSSISNSYPHHWLDRAKTHFGGSFNSWEVEGVKKIYRLLPIFATLMLNWIVSHQVMTTMIYQGEHMNIDSALGFRIPTVLVITFPVVLSVIAVFLLIPIVHKVVYPLLAKLYMYPSHLQIIGIGMLFSVASMACAGGVELHRVAECCIEQDRWGENLTRVSNATIFLQVPQYVLAGFGALFTTFTAFEYTLMEAPKYLQGFALSIFACTLGFGWIASGVLVVVVNAATNGIEGNKWYPDEDQINNGKLANYFFLLAALMFLVFILYVKVALSFKAKKESANLQITENTSTSYRYPRDFTRPASNNLVFTYD